ncbi:MAG: DUF4184 family protein [Promethearchaeota archaeon]
MKIPITPLHYPVAWGLSKLNKRLVLPGLIVGSFIPDIEVPVLFIFFNGVLPDHLILHSLIGALTIGTIISILVTVILYPILASLIFRVDKMRIKEVCRLTPVLIFSCLLGNIFHILLDIPMHPFNPVFWPFIDPYAIIGPLVLAFSVGGDIGLGFLYARILNYVIMGGLMTAILVKSRKNLWEKVLVGNIYFKSEP